MEGRDAMQKGPVAGCEQAHTIQSKSSVAQKKSCWADGLGIIHSYIIYYIVALLILLGRFFC